MNHSFNSDGIDKQNLSQKLPKPMNNTIHGNQSYLSQVPSFYSQDQAYQRPQQFAPVYTSSHYPTEQQFDPMQVLRNQQLYGVLDTQSFVKTMEFKREQEVSKQYSYKLEMLKLSMQANIPGHMIPQLFSNDSTSLRKESSETIEPQDFYDQPDYNKYLPHPNSDVVLIDPHKQIRVQTKQSASISDYIDERPAEISVSNENHLIPPKFKRQHKRTNSPSRIGELGVKALDRVVSVNESQENSKINSRISSGKLNSSSTESPSLFKPKLSAFSNTGNAHTGASPQNSRITSMQTNNLNTDRTKKNLDFNNNVINPQVGSFKPQHRRFNSLPSVLQPSPFLTSSKKTNYFNRLSEDNQTSQALLELSQQKNQDYDNTQKQNKKRTYDLMHSNNKAQIDLNRVTIDDASNLEYVVNKKFKFGTEPHQQTLFSNTSPETDVDSLSNTQSRTVSEDSVTGNTNRVTNKLQNEMMVVTEGSKDGESVPDHDTTIEEEEQDEEKEVNNSNSDSEKTKKKVHFFQPQQSNVSTFTHKRTNTLESILN